MKKPTKAQRAVLEAMAAGQSLIVIPTFNPASGPCQAGYVAGTTRWFWAGLLTWEAMQRAGWIRGRKAGWNSNGPKWRFRITPAGREAIK